MTIPPLYKYLDIQGARLSLKNNCFRHGRPSEFNDTEELTVSSIFPVDDETALKEIENGFTDILLKHLNDIPTGLGPEMRAKVALIQGALKANPGTAKILKEARAKGELSGVFDIPRIKERNEKFLAEINQQMQGYRILCLSTLNCSERMWTRYSSEHQGIALRVTPDIEKDSKYQLCRPVRYYKSRPPLFESAIAFQEGALFGDQEARIRTCMETIIYSKTLEWEYESEYRLAIPLRANEEDWDTLRYHPNEISELYLGAKASDELRAEYCDLAKSLNPQIKIFEMFYDPRGALTFQAFA